MGYFKKNRYLARLIEDHLVNSGTLTKSMKKLKKLIQSILGGITIKPNLRDL